MKDIFILGGSKLQLDLIYEAKKLYLNVHLFDYDENCVGEKYADFFYHIDIKDKDEILKKAKEIKPIAILTIATEVGNITACYVSEKLGLKSNSYKVAIETTNKISMKSIAKKGDIKTAIYDILKKDDDINRWKYFPAIIKPADSSASRGVSFVKDKDEIKKAIQKAFLFSTKDEVLIEEYIQGKQFSVETISSKGIHKLVAITEEYLTKLPDIIETQQLIPARIDEITSNKIEKFINNILDSFSISYGASHIEIKENSDGELYLIELASRMGGWRSELINYAYGVSYCRLLLYSVMDKSIEFEKSKDDTAIVKMILCEDDFVEYTRYLEKYPNYLIEDLNINNIKKSQHLADSNGYYFIHIENKDDISNFIGKHI